MGKSIREYRKRGRPKNLPHPIDEVAVAVVAPPQDKMVKNFLGLCSICNRENTTPICKCGGITRFVRIK